MATAKTGDTVHVHYTGRLDDGTVFDTSDGREPLEFVLGSGDIIPGFDKAVEGLAVGEEVAASIPPEEAYGVHSEALMLRVPTGNFPGETAPEVGQRFDMTGPDGQRTPVLVTSVEEDVVEIDANHVLAGQQLNFDLKLVKIG